MLCCGKAEDGTIGVVGERRRRVISGEEDKNEGREEMDFKFRVQNTTSSLFRTKAITCHKFS